MKTINDIIVEAKKKTYLTQLELLTISIPIGMWIEYGSYGKFFNDLSNDDKQHFKDFLKESDDICLYGDGKSKMLYSKFAKNELLIKLVDFLLSLPVDELGKSNVRILKEIKANIDMRK